MILHSPTANTWTLRLLLTQLYDPAMDVCELATQFLEEACESVDILQLVVAMQPTLDHLGIVGHGLLLKCVEWRFAILLVVRPFAYRFMSTPVGFRYLFDSGYIDREMDIWFHVSVFQFHDKLSALITSPLKGTQHSLRYRNRGLACGDNGAHPGGRRR
jgi:rapamycin-insensitive companion of mTOR